MFQWLSWRLRHRCRNKSHCAVFTEQGSPASQMTAAKVTDIISRLPGCGQGADAISPSHQAKMEDAKTQSFHLNGIRTVIFWQEKFQVGNVSSYTEKKGQFLSMWTTSNLLERNKNINPMWKVLMKDVDLVEPTSFLWPYLFGLHSTGMWNEQRYCGKLQRPVWIKDLRRSNRNDTLFKEDFTQISFLAKKCVERHCEHANITTGRSPTMKHVSRSHRVALDWLIDRINLEPKIQIVCRKTCKSLQLYNLVHNFFNSDASSNEDTHSKSRNG